LIANALTAKRIGQNYTDLRWIHRLPETSSKQGYTEDKNVSEQVQPNRQPALNRDCHVVCAILHVQPCISTFHGTGLGVDEDGVLDELLRLTCSRYALIVERPVNVSEYIG
jgi:hypothetical protein